jgi:hypothetical protein
MGKPQHTACPSSRTIGNLELLFTRTMGLAMGVYDVNNESPKPVSLPALSSDFTRFVANESEHLGTRRSAATIVI